MSTRTKSFFDQNNKEKQRPPQWHRPQNRIPLNETDPNVAPSKPPIPATSEAKSKLKAFQFVPGHPDELVANNPEENEKGAAHQDSGSAPQEVMELMEAEAPDDAGLEAKQTGKTASAPQLTHANTYPSTPCTRLPLEDLIGNFEEKKAEAHNESPEEYIGWIPNSSSALLTPNRKRKRARSSSPSSCPNTSSQRQETSAFFVGTAARAEKKTPEADPSAALWQRFETGKVDSAANLPDLSHLIGHASPRAIETPAKNAGFRRWASTGNEWPTSKSKRRRTDGHTRISVLQDTSGAHSSETSKFANMLKKVEESLATQRLAKEQSRPAVRIEAPSSSSPLPEVGAPDAFADVPAASPLETRHNALLGKPQKLSPNAAVMIPNKATSTLPTGEDATNEKSLQQTHAAIDSVVPAPVYVQSQPRLPAYKRPTITRNPSNGAQQSQAVQAPAPVAPVPTDLDMDEFGDAFELSAEDLEELVSQPPPLHLRPLHQIPQHPNPPPEQHYLDPGQHHVPVQSAENAGTAAQPIELTEFDDDNDEFGMDDIDEASFVAAECNATQTFRISPRKRSPRKSLSKTKGLSLSSPTQTKFTGETKTRLRFLQRYTVKQIVEGEYTNAKGRRSPEKVLLVHEERTLKTTAITLRDSWMSTSVSVGNTVHVAHLRQIQSPGIPSSPPGQVTISDTDTSPLFIIHPDHMLSATTVADSFDCIRKAVLQDRIKATGETSKPMVYGKLLHEIFQQALSANRWEDAFLVELVERTVQNHVESLWELGMTDTVLAIEEVSAKMDELASWARTFVAETPSDVALVDDKQGEKVWMSISKLIAIEEHVWSPQYGLKGNIDATVQTTLVDHPQQPGKRLIVPFEVKTGRTTQSPAHRAQTALYTLLLSDRYDLNVQAGILYYLESSAMSRIAPPTNEIRQMIQQRNRLAAYLHRAKYPTGESITQIAEPQTQEIEESGLPSLLKSPFKCGRCYAQQSCFTYHGLVENGSADSAGMIDDGKKNHALVWHEAVGHLQLSSSKDRAQAGKLRAWFVKWDRLLTFEEGDLSRLRRELWTMDSTEREAAGRCFGNLVVERDLTPSTAAATSSSTVDGIEGSGGRINRFAYTFANATRRLGHSFIQGTQLNVGEPVVVSSESGQWALANGYVVAATKHNITVAVDRKLGNARLRLPEFDSERHQAFVGIMTVGDSQEAATTASKQEQPTLYRLDKDEFSNGLALVRNNLVTLMSSHPIHTKLREQVIFSKKPEFLATHDTPQLPPSQIGEMNEDQTAAVHQVLNAQDYALILGMPGTGKTTTIAHIIRALLVEQKSILLASFTHTAVDNILLKIRDIAPPNSILRLGVPAKINPQVQEFCQLAMTPRKTIDEVEEALMGCQIVATTCMGTNHALFHRRAFDVCIMDEASQITLPTSLGPLLHARKFVLVGDHYQLPPLVQNKAALEGGLDVSLFRQLSEEHPEAVARLGKQYRMCEDVMSLSNALIYDGQLRCGNDDVAHRTIRLGDFDALSAFHAASQNCLTPSNGGRCWIENVLQVQRKVVFANTDATGKAAHETLTLGKNITNHFEAAVLAQLVLSLLALGVPGTDIGIITLYRSQLALIRQLFKKAGVGSDVEIDSADRFQGRDKECIILSMVRSNEAGIVGDLLKDWRRVNVALTRARSKLVVLGSRRTLCNNELLAKFLALVDERRWAMDLPKDADACHSFNFSSQAASDLVAQSASSPDNAREKHTATEAENISSTPKVKRGSPRKFLGESPNTSNQSPRRNMALKEPAKTIFGKISRAAAPMSRKAMEQAAFDIFEDLSSENL